MFVLEKAVATHTHTHTYMCTEKKKSQAHYISMHFQERTLHFQADYPRRWHIPSRQQGEVAIQYAAEILLPQHPLCSASRGTTLLFYQVSQL